MPESCCFLIGTDHNLQVTVLAEPLSIALYAAKFLGQINVKDAAILGAGPIGLCTLFALRNIKVGSLFVTDKISARLEKANKLGASWIGNPEETDIVKEILDIKTEGINAVFECCGDQEALDQAIDLLKPGGKLFIIGIPDTDQISFNISKLRRKEIAIQNVRRQNNCLPEAIQWIQENRFGIHQLITHRFNLENVREAFDLVANYSDNVIKAIIEINKD